MIYGRDGITNQWRNADFSTEGAATIGIHMGKIEYNLTTTMSYHISPRFPGEWLKDILVKGKPAILNKLILKNVFVTFVVKNFFKKQKKYSP